MRSALAVAGTMTLLSSCRSFYPLRPNEQITPEKTVAVAFASARDLEVTSDTVEYAVPAVRKVYGKVDEVRSDTLVVRVLRLESRKRQPELPRNARLTVVPDASARVAMRRVSPGKTAALMAGVTALGLIALALANFELGPCTNCSY
jgi:hypothetical protein